MNSYFMFSYAMDGDSSGYTESYCESGFVCNPTQLNKHTTARQQKHTREKKSSKQPARFVAMFP